VVTPLSWLFTQ